MRARLKLIAATFAMILLGYAGGGVINWVRLPGVDLSFDPNGEAFFADQTSPTVGDRNAPVTVLIFTDYRCAVCRRDHEGVAKVIASDRRARFVFKEWAVLGPVSKDSARLALGAAYQGRYLAVRDALMRGEAPPVDRVRLRRDQARHDMAIEAELARVNRQAFTLGLPGTPAYLVGRRLVIGGLSERQLRRLITRAANDA